MERYLKSSEALKRLYADSNGVVFSTDTATGIGSALQAGLSAIVSFIPTT